MEKAVILAAGLGKRMQQSDEAAPLTADQTEKAASGAKAFMPITAAGKTTTRPFLDYLLSAVADAGYRQVCLVVAPNADAMRDYYANLSTTRLSIDFAVQPQPMGTANAVLAAVDFTGQDHFLVINSDNLYPRSTLSSLRNLNGSGLVGFDRQSLSRLGNIPADRVDDFARLQVNASGELIEIVEKPTAGVQDALVSMNCWRFGPSIHIACRKIEPSIRGEYEIPDAVTFTRNQLGESFQVLKASAGVLDLSRRTDIAAVSRYLRDETVNL